MRYLLPYSAFLAAMSLLIFCSELGAQTCYELVWSQEFNKPGLPDSTVWTNEVGGGGWGTALALVAGRNGHRVRVWGPFAEYIDDIRARGENVKFLPGVSLPADLSWTAEPAAAMAEAGQRVALVDLDQESLDLVEHVFHRRITEVVKQLHAMNSQHHRQWIRTAAAPCFGIVPADLLLKLPFVGDVSL